MRALCAVLLAATAAPADAGVVVGEGVPFTAGDLEHALAARRPAVLALALEVRAIAPRRMRVVGSDGHWDVDVGEARGAAAARLVALNVLGITDAEVVAPPVRPRRAAVRVTATAGAGRGVGRDDLPVVVGGIEVSAGRRWRLGGAVEWREALEAAPRGAVPVDGRTWLARATIGRALGPIELAAGPLIGRLHVDSAPGTRAWQSGVALSARAGWPIAAHWSLVIGAGVDGYRHRVEVRREGQVVAATPRVAIGASVGLRWELGR